MPSRKKAALDAAAVAVPELAVPASVIAELLQSRSAGSMAPAAGGSQVLTDSPKFLTLREARIRVRKVKGVSYILFEPSKGLTGKETAALAAVVAAPLTLYLGAKDIEKWWSGSVLNPVHDSSSFLNSLNPFNWKWPKL